MRACLPEMRGILRGENALSADRQAGLEALIDALANAVSSMPKPTMSNCSTAAAIPRCTCSSMCTGIRATVVRR